MKYIAATVLFVLLQYFTAAQSLVGRAGDGNSFPLTDITISVDPSEEELIRRSAVLLQQDLELLTGKKPQIVHTPGRNTTIIIGSQARLSQISRQLRQQGFSVPRLAGKWETYQIQTSNNQVLIAGSDRRGTAYGIIELSRQLGVSPWYWWADVPVEKKDTLHLLRNRSVTGGPSVKYRGIFLNDEAPALSGWAKEKFGGFNHAFYEKVFELMLRLKANYIWPAMWGNKFYDDDSLNIRMADRYGIVVGTSHHEPLMRAHDEWRKYGVGKWNYDSNAVALQHFWEQGMRRATNEKIVTIGMRGDGDEPMSRETATALLERIVADQRRIIARTTGKPASSTPQLWALYKEVQDYYEKGMRVPDDVTLLLCDDNWGNLRKLPALSGKPRKGGYGIYYHFDYVGGPRNYKWLNTNPLPRIWEQMHLAWEYNAREIWIVNVGDLKPMELPVSFFLDYAWNPPATGPAAIQSWTEQWAAAQFGSSHAGEIAAILARYAKFNARRKPELLDANTFDLLSGEWERVVQEYQQLQDCAEVIRKQLPASCQDAYYQLVLHPVTACCNLYKMYYHTALNKQAKEKNLATTNAYADSVVKFYQADSLITLNYHRLKNGKWNHLMSQTHIGYTYWQQPEKQKMPALQYLPAGSGSKAPVTGIRDIQAARIPAGSPANSFYQLGGSGVAIEAAHFTRAFSRATEQWTVLADHGRTGSAITIFPVTTAAQPPAAGTPRVEYDIYTFGEGDVKIHSYHSPTLNFTGAPEGLQYAISIDDEAPQVVSINKEDKNSISGIWNKWVAENIIIKTTNHRISGTGKHTVRYWMVDPGPVLQKIVVDFGDTAPSYLGPTETRNETARNDDRAFLQTKIY